ncbi:unnamed protein product [Arctogadus glacialis]
MRETVKPELRASLRSRLGAVVYQGVLFATRGPTLNHVCPLSEAAVALQETAAALPPRCGGRQGAGRLQAPGGSAALKQEERD